MSRSAIVAVLVPLLVSAGLTACAEQAAPAAPSNLRTAAEAGEARWGVPADLLLALAWTETRWSIPARDEDDAEHAPLTLGSAGLRRSPLVEDVLAELGTDEAALATDPVIGVLAASGVLARLADEAGVADPGDPAAYRDALAAYAELSGRDGERYADAVLRVLVVGLEADTAFGEHVVIAARPIAPASGVGLAMEYGGSEYGDATWSAASSENYTAGRGGHSIRYIVIHDTEGSYAGAISWFRNPAASVSAHYVIRSSDGDITQMVSEGNTGWHAGNWTYNQESIGIEHEGYYREPARWYTEAMYAASARLVRHLCGKYGIPMDRAHIIAHSEVPGATHVDPGPGWDWDHYMALVRGEPPRPAYDATAGATSIPAEMTAGDRLVAWIELSNTGSATWDIDGTRLGTAAPRDHDSPFFDMENWMSPSRASGADHDYAPGSTGRFTFMIHAPEVTTDTTVTETFALVQEGVTWFGPEIPVSVLVHPRAAADGDGDGAAADVDCDDADPGAHPGAAETCGDGIDQNCDGNDIPCVGDAGPAGDAGAGAPDAGAGGGAMTRRVAGGCSASGGRAPAPLLLVGLALLVSTRARRSRRG